MSRSLSWTKRSHTSSGMDSPGSLDSADPLDPPDSPDSSDPLDFPGSLDLPGSLGSSGDFSDDFSVTALAPLPHRRPDGRLAVRRIDQLTDRRARQPTDGQF
ncbi:hypothetical protein GCM10017557_31400 [Streptomyces aurantiacus]|uniref:Uncharacterized protein n=1 Tax=Streptomyces aurantiacus TaxID=47760 RepID=A0A7G1P0Y5_9ACTN|nr:hypothetical protein GCM10017557_31400 [Streptomyces aurantiacus]